MHLTIVRPRTEDNLEHQGILFEHENQEKKAKVVVFVHGAGSSFMDDRFPEELARQLTARGVAFFAANNRGHDVVSDVRMLDDSDIKTTVRLGHAYELFVDCMHDIASYINLVIDELGYESVILMGHSLGASKAAYYMAETGDSRVCALVLASPPDIQGLLKDAANPKRNESESGEPSGNILLDKYRIKFPVNPPTQKSFLGKRARANMFPFHNRRARFARLGKITVPILALYGTEDEPVVTPIVDCLSIIAKKAISSAHVSRRIIAGAPHNYLAYEGRVAWAITRWVVCK